MKKKFTYLAMSGILIGTTLLSSGCVVARLLHNHEDPPQSIEIEGATYVTDFYDSDRMTTRYSKREDPRTPLFVEGDYEWWQLKGTEFQLYGAKLNHAMDWVPQVYCKADQLQEVKAYYADLENYTYGFSYPAHQQIPITEEVDRAQMELVLKELYDARLKEDDYSAFEGKYELVELNMSQQTCLTVSPYRVSKDGVLATRLKDSYFYVDGKLYMAKWEGLEISTIFEELANGKSLDDILGEYHAKPKMYYLLDDEHHTYLVELFDKYAKDTLLGLNGGNHSSDEA